MSAGFAQMPPGSISGTVQAAVTGTVLPNTTVWIQSGTRRLEAITDARGRYKLPEVPPGIYVLTAQTQSRTVNTATSMSYTAGHRGAKHVSVAPGQDLTAVDIEIQIEGSIAGKVVDGNKEPVADMVVWLVKKEYVGGVLHSFLSGHTKTNDLGEYRLNAVPAGRAYYVLAGGGIAAYKANAGDPADPKLRRPVVMPSYYPDSPAIEGALPVEIGPGEVREGIDIRTARATNYCIEGVTQAQGAASALDLSLLEEQPTNGSGSSSRVPPARTGAAGKFRLCGIHPGQYRLSAAGLGIRGAMPVTVKDEDLRGIKVNAVPGVTLAVEMAWDGVPPDPPVEAKVSLLLDAVTDVERERADATVPGGTSFTGVALQDYSVNVIGLPAGMYVKDITYGGSSIQNESLHPGTAMGNAGLRITVARDGTTASATVTDKDGNPVEEACVYVMPAAAASPAALAATLVWGQTDQHGAYTSSTLPPGKYYVLASKTRVYRSPESIEKLWGTRNHAQEIEVPGASAHLILQ